MRAVSSSGILIKYYWTLLDIFCKVRLGEGLLHPRDLRARPKGPVGGHADDRVLAWGFGTQSNRLLFQ